MDIVYLNGSFLPIAEAKVSVLDRGFLFADGVYEVIPIYNGKPFLLDEHLARLARSLLGLELKIDISFAAIKTIIHQLILKNAVSKLHSLIYLQVTRGRTEERKHIYTDDYQATLFVKLMPFTPGAYAKGVKVITENDCRGDRCDIKDIAKLYHAIALKKARAQGADEVIYIRDGSVTEGASSNVFGVKEGVVYTPPQSTAILSGITRAKVIALLKENNVPVEETEISTEQLFTMDEIWLTASSKEITNVVVVDNAIISQENVLYSKIVKCYQKLTPIFDKALSG